MERCGMGVDGKAGFGDGRWTLGVPLGEGGLGVAVLLHTGSATRNTMSISSRHPLTVVVIPSQAGENGVGGIDGVFRTSRTWNM